MHPGSQPSTYPRPCAHTHRRPTCVNKGAGVPRGLLGEPACQQRRRSRGGIAQGHERSPVIDTRKTDSGRWQGALKIVWQGAGSIDQSLALADPSLYGT